MAFDPTMRTLVLNPDQSKLVDVKSVETRGVKGFRSRACAMVLNEIEATAVSYVDKNLERDSGEALKCCEIRGSWRQDNLERDGRHRCLSIHGNRGD